MPDKQHQLNRHKRIATGLFIGMALVYLLMIYGLKLHPQNWMGYVKAFAEAAMVGALADWFAVTALFRKPMNLPIPHTNLIENSKNKIGDNLGAFVTDNFLTAENVRPYITKIDLAHLLANWLNNPTNQKHIEKEGVALLLSIINGIDQEEVILFLSKKAKSGIADLPLQEFASKGLVYMLEKQEHNRLIDVIIPKAQLYVEENRATIYSKIVEKKPLLALVGGKTVTNQLIQGIITFLEEIAIDPKHKLRKELTSRLYQLADEIETSALWKEKFNALASEFVSDEVIQNYVTDFWTSTQETIIVQLLHENSNLRGYIQRAITTLSNDLQRDKQLSTRINVWVQHTLYRLVLRNTKEVGVLIRNTVERWDGRELSDKLELEVGKDLQFIRINGTLVGGLVGLLLYTLTQLLT